MVAGWWGGRGGESFIGGCGRQVLVAGVAVPALVGGPDGETKHHLSLESTKRSSFTGMLAPEMLTRYTSGCGI